MVMLNQWTSYWKLVNATTTTNTGSVSFKTFPSSEVDFLEEELKRVKEEYNILYNSLNTIGEQLLKQIALNRILAKENEILLEQKEAIWQSIQKK